MKFCITFTRNGHESAVELFTTENEVKERFFDLIYDKTVTKIVVSKVGNT